MPDLLSPDALTFVPGAAAAGHISVSDATSCTSTAASDAQHSPYWLVDAQPKWPPGLGRGDDAACGSADAKDKRGAPAWALPEAAVAAETYMDCIFAEVAFTKGAFADGAFAESDFTEGVFASFADAGLADGGFADGGFAEGGFAEGGFADDGFAGGVFAEGGFADGAYTDGARAFLDGTFAEGVFCDGLFAECYADGHFADAPTFPVNDNVAFDDDKVPQALSAAAEVFSLDPDPPFASTSALARRVAPRPKGLDDLVPVRICVGNQLDGLGALELIRGAEAASRTDASSCARGVPTALTAAAPGEGRSTHRSPHGAAPGAILRQRRRSSPRTRGPPVFID